MISSPAPKPRVRLTGPDVSTAGILISSVCKGPVFILVTGRLILIPQASGNQRQDSNRKKYLFRVHRITPILDGFLKGYTKNWI